MALTFDGLNYISKASALVAAAPMTFACWVNITTNPATFCNIMSITSSGSGHQSLFGIAYSTSGTKMCCRIINDTGTADTTALASLAISLGTWYHVACVFTSATSRTCYVNGANSVSSAVSITPSTCNGTYIGDCFSNASTFTGLIGSVAFPAIWSVALSAANIASLALGDSPLHYHPAGLVSYARLTGGNSPEPDMISGSWTLVSG